MNLKLRRNLPLVVLLLAILTFLALVLGDQPIIAYTAAENNQQAAPTATVDSDMRIAVSGTTGLFDTLSVAVGSPEQ